MFSSALYIQSLGTASAAGIGLAALRRTLFGEENCLMRPQTRLAPDPAQPYCCGILEAADPTDSTDRTQRLLDLCLAQMSELKALLSRTEPTRVAVVLGACTAGMHRIEEAMSERERTGALPADFDVRRLNLFEPSRYVAEKIGALGPVYTLSNACASGLMAPAAAADLLRADLADVVVTGGCDGFCRFTNEGFCALSAVSPDRCRPFDAARHGINLGEGGALVAMTRQKDGALLALSGMGETTDAHHLSAPDPEGIEASHAMRLALEEAQLSAGDIDLVIAHGTGTPLNDAMESKAVHAVFGPTVPCASFKALSGHTLAGAGALQAACAAALLIDNPEGYLAPSANLDTIDPQLAAVDVVQTRRALGRPLNHVLANAFAFGGSNASAVFSRVTP